MYCKLPTNSKKLPAFPLEPTQGSIPGLRGGRRECYHSATVAPIWSMRMWPYFVVLLNSGKNQTIFFFTFHSTCHLLELSNILAIFSYCHLLATYLAQSNIFAWFPTISLLWCFCSVFTNTPKQLHSKDGCRSFDILMGKPKSLRKINRVSNGAWTIYTKAIPMKSSTSLKIVWPLLCRRCCQI